MNFNQLLSKIENEPVFESSVLLAGDVDPANINLQLSRWTEAGRIYQLRRGLYALAPPYQRVRPHPFMLANRLSRGSYVSLQSALAYYELIPETVFVTTSVTTGRTQLRKTPLGDFDFYHIKKELMYGYKQLDLGERQSGYVAQPEKALLDIIYLQTGGDKKEYIQSLRLQNLELLEVKQLSALADCSGSLKLMRAVKMISKVIQDSDNGYKTL